MPDKSIILIFVKVPLKGQVKSRVAAVVGDETALGLYKNFVLDVIDTVIKTGCPFRICYAPAEAGQAMTGWLNTDCPLKPQQGNDLGERMENAFIQCFAEGIERVVLIGSDLPDLAPAILHEALSSLARKDVVIGPAFDGGYYLIGFNRRSFLPKIFHGIAWGTATVFQDTIAILGDHALTVHRAPQWHDVDTSEDLKALCRRARDTGFDNSRTMDYCRINRLCGDGD
jgi:rSAM/selenodomain-associated transferase 1